MEDEIHWLCASRKAELCSNRILQGLKDCWLKYNVSWLINAMNVSECCGDHVTTTLTVAECLESKKCILWSGVQLGVVLCLDAIFFSANNTNFNF